MLDPHPPALKANNQGSALERLCAIVASIPAGPITDPAQVELLLSKAWDELRGAYAESMRASKVLGRTEDMAWNPPELSFQIERHGAVAMGGTRAEIHYWTVDVEAGLAMCSRGGVRQIKPRAKVVHVEELADEVVRAVVQHDEHVAVTWLTSTRFRLVPSNVDALRDGYKQTLEGRKKRFFAALQSGLNPLGWSRTPARNRFEYERSDGYMARGTVTSLEDMRRDLEL